MWLPCLSFCLTLTRGMQSYTSPKRCPMKSPWAPLAA